MDKYSTKSYSRPSSKNQRGVEIDDSILTATEKEATRIEKPISRHGAKIATALCILLVLILWLRLGQLSILMGAQYKEISKENRIRQNIIKAPRGKIFDKKGTSLVENIPSIDVTIVPNQLPQDQEQRQKVSQTLAEILNMNEAGVQVFIDSLDLKESKAQILAANISQDQSLVISERLKDLPGASLEKTATRQYVDGMIFSDIIGYDGKITKDELDQNPNYSLTDTIGKTGLEKTYEKYLHGVDGAELVEVDSLGNPKKDLGSETPQKGSDLYLNINADLQKKIYDSLSTMIEKNDSKMAAAVAIDPRNGGVLAMTSLPSYDNNLFSKGISSDDYNTLIKDPLMPLFNRAVSGEYPPGSTIKPVVATAALEEKVVNESTTVDDPGAISIGSYTFRDWKAHGVTDIKKAIAESCDVFFYSVGGGWGNINGLGMDKMKQYENAFGFGSRLGIDTTGEAPGLIPDENWKEKEFNESWYIGDSYHAAIGQGFVEVTPLQLANSIATIANNGILFKPHIVSNIKNRSSETEIKPEILNNHIASPATLKIVQEGMRQTVESGTAQILKDLPVAVAGKTGTAQYGTEGKTHSWFVSYAPYDNPQIAMAVLVEGGGEGNTAALPVTKDVYQWYFDQQNNNQ